VADGPRAHRGRSVIEGAVLEVLIEAKCPIFQ
jgi:hypothetical protein